MENYELKIKKILRKLDSISRGLITVSFIILFMSILYGLMIDNFYLAFGGVFLFFVIIIATTSIESVLKEIIELNVEDKGFKLKDFEKK